MVASRAMSLPLNAAGKPLASQLACEIACSQSGMRTQQLSHASYKLDVLYLPADIPVCLGHKSLMSTAGLRQDRSCIAGALVPGADLINHAPGCKPDKPVIGEPSSALACTCCVCWSTASPEVFQQGMPVVHLGVILQRASCMGWHSAIACSAARPDSRRQMLAWHAEGFSPAHLQPHSHSQNCVDDWGSGEWIESRQAYVISAGTR